MGQEGKCLKETKKTEASRILERICQIQEARRENIKFIAECVNQLSPILKSPCDSGNGEHGDGFISDLYGIMDAMDVDNEELSDIRDTLQKII